MISRIFKPPKTQSFFLFGPRGVGKTKYLRETFPDALYIDLLEDETFNLLTSSTQRLEGLVSASNRSTVIIDEIQKIPRILDEVHRLMELKKIRFILTGSSARKLRRSGVNLLAGRAYTKHLYPFCALELGEKFSLRHSLAYGNLPMSYFGEDPKAYLTSYLTTYLKEEVQQEGLTRNLGAFARFLEGASLSQAQPLNISEVARESSVERKVVEQYFSILEDLLLAVRVPVFTKKAKRAMTHHPKFFYFDTGVFRSIRPKGPLDTVEEIDGAALETLFFQELRALNDYLDLGYELFFWRARTKEEVDLVAYGERGILAFEIKRSLRVRREDIAGLNLFLQDYPEARAFLLYGGTKHERVGAIDALPFETGVRELPEILAQR